MLKKLIVDNFILINHCVLDFNNSFSVFTGETGAGKSLLIDAISLLQGDRASCSMIQNNQPHAYICGVFDFSNNIKDVLLELKIEDQSNVIIERYIYKDNKSIAKINNKTVSLSILKKLVDNYVDIHSQFDTQYLLNKSNHLHLIDQLVEDKDLIKDVKDKFKVYKKNQDELDDLLQSKLNLDDVSIIEDEIFEINIANLFIGEDDILEKQTNEIKNFEKIYEKLNLCNELFDDDNGVDTNLYNCINALESLSNLNIDKIDKLSDSINTCYYDIKDLFEQLNDYKNSLTYSESEMDNLTARLFEIKRLKRKYGISIKMILEHKTNLINRIDMINNRQQFIDELNLKIDESYNHYYKSALKLSSLRRTVATKLCDSIIKQCNDLCLPHANFICDFSDIDKNINGIDDIEFLVSMNPGEMCKSIKKVASGGELSRLMLALKTIFTKLENISLVIFDEIDTGVSGIVALSIGKKMAFIGDYAQVFSVTHLAQVAACSTNHYLVKKDVIDNLPIVSIELLDKKERINQLALMSSGIISESSINAASELLNNALK